MKKILFSLVALVTAMSMNAQILKVTKGTEVVATYVGTDYKFSFEESVKVASITLNKTATEIVAGKMDTLVATVAPANATIDSVTWSSSTPSVATISAEGVVTAIAEGAATITATATDGSGVTATCVVTVTVAPITGTSQATINGNQVSVNWVQLWENGPRFAEYNVGVTDGKAESFGGYYAWGGNQDKVDDHNTGSVDLTGNDDTATNLWGSNWRMPTMTELQALLDNCDVVWTTVGGVNGRKFTGRGDYSENSVFLPAAGYCYSGSVQSQGDRSYYWSSTPRGNNASLLFFKSGNQYVDNDARSLGISVRAVLVE